MKRIFIFSLICLYSALHAQSVVTLAAKAQENFRSKNFEQSALYFDSMKVFPYFFNNTFNVILNKAIQQDSASRAMIDYYSSTELQTASWIKPMKLYLDIVDCKENLMAQTYYEKLMGIMTSKSDSTYYSTLFYTASYFELRKKMDLSGDRRIQMLQALVGQNKITSTKKFIGTKELKAYMNMVHSNELYKMNGNYKKVLDIDLSAEELDRMKYFPLHSHEGDKLLSQYDIKKPIIDSLLGIEHSYENLTYVAKLVSSYPSEDNLMWLRSNYVDSFNFNEFWFKVGQSNWDDFPTNEKLKKYLSPAFENKQWIVLDIWGTWCSPCVKEMPELAAMEQKFKQVAGNPIVFMTVSYGSKDLEGFMSTNNYSFPIYEAEKSDMDFLNVHSYPTTFLIAPNKKYMIIPDFTDKQEIIKVFTLLDW